MLDIKTVKMIGMDVEKALIDVSKKYNVNIKRGSTRYDSNNMNMKLEISVINSNGDVMSREAMDYKNYAPMYNIESELGDVIYHMGKEYKVVGWKPRSTKYPVLMEEVNSGTVYKFPVTLLPKKGNGTGRK